MFTGLVEEVGLVRRFEKKGEGGRLAIAAQKVLEGTRLGDSIAVSGACLTVVELGNDGFTVDCMPETLTHTTLGSVTRGATVNLERSLALGDRLGGHLVLGHVDAVAEVVKVEREGEFQMITFSLPETITAYVAPKGSVAVDGVSLTVVRVDGGRFSVGVIPHTLEQTTLSRVRPGVRVNVEADVIARYVFRSLQAGRGEEAEPSVQRGLTEEFLREKGFA
jgi:riboflavin synthase